MLNQSASKEPLEVGEEIYEDGGMERIKRFDDLNYKKATCRTCAYAMPFQTAVVCGVHHCTFSYNSLCDEYKTIAERKIELDDKKAKMLADPNSLINRLKNNPL